MTLTQITYFNAVCEYQNVTKAANALYVSRTAVSRALKDLENEWDLVLFKRSRTGVELTEDGEKVREIFHDFNNSYMALKKSINDRKRAEMLPELRIGITTTTGSMFAEFIRDFRSQHPDIRLRLMEYSIHDSINVLMSGDIDFFITPHIVNESSNIDIIEKVPTYTSELVLCVSTEHPLSSHSYVTDEEVEPLDKASLLTPLPSLGLSEYEFRMLVNREKEGDYVIRSSQQQLIHKAVAANFAVIVLPREIVEQWSDICTIPFRPRKLFPVYVIWDKNLRHSGARKLFMDHIRSYWGS